MKRLLLSLLALGLLAVVAVMAATAPAANPSPRTIAPGVRVAGVRVGGLTSEPARVRIRAAFERPLVFAYHGKRWRVSASALGASAAVDDGVTAALRAHARQHVRLAVGVRGREIGAYVTWLSHRYTQSPKDAQLVGLSNLTPVISQERWGLSVDTDAMRARIARALRTTSRKPIQLPMRAVAPKVTRASFGAIVVIHRVSNSLQLFSGSQPVRSFGVATGQARYPTPLGLFSVVDKQLNPWWRPPDSDWARGKEPIPPGPGNPLGTRWMGLSAPGVGIHGTPDAASIGYSASHGCIRMQIPDAEWLFEHVTWGTPVFIVDA
jgi:lipoprotein-anchoring transpeptidase ErfK/SrfK